VSVRDEELKRLEQYARGLGTSVTYKPHTPGSAGAEWILTANSPEIIMYTWSGQSKTRLILDLVHELAHHYAWIANNRQEHPDLISALVAEAERKPGDPPIPKAQRKLIFIAERDDARFRESIWHEVNIKIPQWKLHLDVDLDNYVYKCYYKEGDTPTTKRIRNARKRYSKFYNKGDK